MIIFNVWKAAFEERTGVQITPDRERALALLLERRIKQLDPGDIDQYMNDALDIAKGAEEWSGLVDSLLIKETSFFRHRPSMDYVQAWVEQGVEEICSASPCGYGAWAAPPVRRPTPWQYWSTGH